MSPEYFLIKVMTHLTFAFAVLVYAASLGTLIYFGIKKDYWRSAAGGLLLVLSYFLVMVLTAAVSRF